ncbi:uncharacterized protein LOC117107844 [Anneissia japonica]|uniref:uncharacterized protein LOC117107844 n=1 Tax=Anneissia japonica TaxID=1529436 RepID=UPI0014256623|nr:uncharacterized protein LOC117107844 [Anneissia japonica]
MNIVFLLCISFYLFSVGVCYTHINLKLGVQTSTQTVPCNDLMYYQVNVTDPCKDLMINVNVLEGEPNVYVSRGNTKFPNERSLAWSSYNWGSENLTISSWDPEFSIGTFYIGVHAYCGSDVASGYTDAKFTLQALSVDSIHPSDEIPLNGMIRGNISAENYLYYRFCVSSNCNNVEVKLENCIDPAKCPTNYAWPELLVSRSIVKPTINDHAWKLASIERRSVYLYNADSEFYPGHYFIGVYGWCTPEEFCNNNSSCGPCNYADNHSFNLSVIVTDVQENACVPKGPLQLCEVKYNTTNGSVNNAKGNFIWLLTLTYLLTKLF